MDEKDKNEEKGKTAKNNQTPVQKARNGMQAGGVFGAILAVISIFIFVTWGQFLIARICAFLIGGFVFICVMVLLSSVFDYKEAIKIQSIEAESLKEEKEFSEIDMNKKDLRAEKMYRMNQNELKRYYDLNLAQTKYLSVLGICLIFVGTLTVIISVIIYFMNQGDIALFLIGNISGILVDFVGALFVKMYNKNVEAAIMFHSKFVESNKLLLSNAIAHKIENEELREETLSVIAKKIVEH